MQACTRACLQGPHSHARVGMHAARAGQPRAQDGAPVPVQPRVARCGERGASCMRARMPACVHLACMQEGRLLAHPSHNAELGAQQMCAQSPPARKGIVPARGWGEVGRPFRRPPRRPPHSNSPALCTRATRAIQTTWMCPSAAPGFGGEGVGSVREAPASTGLPALLHSRVHTTTP